MVWVTDDQRIIGVVGIGRTAATAPKPTVPPAPGAGGMPSIPKAPPVTPRRPTTFYAEHERIKRAIDEKGKRGYCITPAELAAATSLPIERVMEHLQVLELDEAVATVQKGVDNPAVCSVDALSALVQRLRKLRV